MVIIGGDLNRQVRKELDGYDGLCIDMTTII